MPRRFFSLALVLALIWPIPSAWAQQADEVDPAWAAEVAESWLENCTLAGPDTLHLWSRQDAAPGARLVIVPHNGAEPLLHPVCLAELAVSPQNAGSVLPDGRTIVIAPHAQPGTVITVSALVGDDRLTREIRVIAPDTRSLDGRWTQVDAACAGRSLNHVPLRELEIRDGWFGATFQPFESYRDFAGDVVWTPDTMTLELVVTARNARWEMDGGPGTAYLTADDQLVLDGFMFGHTLIGRALESDCRYTFERL